MPGMAFMQHDADMERRVTAAAEAGMKPVYVGSIDLSSGTCSVGLQARILDAWCS